MDVIASFLAVVDSFCAARDISEARASTIVLNGGGRISAIRAGTSDIGARRLAEAMQWFSDHWPEGAVWPADVTRPERTPVAPPPPAPAPELARAG